MSILSGGSDCPFNLIYSGSIDHLVWSNMNHCFVVDATEEIFEISVDALDAMD